MAIPCKRKREYLWEVQRLIMEQEQNPLEDWINADKQLEDLLIQIEATGLPLHERVEIAFNKISDLYGY